jgi:F420-dependent oxidoreductase-like protein
MKLAVPVAYANNFRETMDNLTDYEHAGVDRVVVAEAYSFDAVSQLGYIAARTEKMELASGILPLFSRTPTNMAMTAAGLDYVSDGRFVLGIGASGPQVIEGFHGQKYDAPLGRAREYAEICRKVWRRERTEYQGKYYKLPLTKEDGGTGLGKPLKLINHPVRERIPMALASIGPKNVSLAAELFEEWQPIFFYPEKAQVAFGDALAAGRAKRDPSLGELGVTAMTALAITEDENLAAGAQLGVRHNAALYIGGMGARGKNFYNDLAVRYGFADEAKVIQDLYLDGKKQEAAELVPQALVDGISLVGSEGHVRERIAAFAEAGVNVLSVQPIAEDHAGVVRQFEQIKQIITDLGV